MTHFKMLPMRCCYFICYYKLSDASLFMDAYGYNYVAKYACMYVHMYVLCTMYVSKYACMYACLHVRLYLHMCDSLYVYMYVYVHMLIKHNICSAYILQICITAKHGLISCTSIQIAHCQIVKSVKKVTWMTWENVPNVLEYSYLTKALAMKVCKLFFSCIYIVIYTYHYVDCGIPNCIICDKVDNKCIHCKSGYRITSDGGCEGK